MHLKQLDAARLTGLSERDGGERWLKALAEAGVVRRDGADALPPPLQAMAALFGVAWALARADAAISALRVTDRVYLAAPPGAWLALPLGYLLCIFLAMFRDSFEDRLLTFSHLLLGAGVLAGGLGVWIGAATWSQRREKHQRLQEAQEARRLLAAQAVAARQALLETSFIVKTGPEDYVMHLPALLRVEAQLQRLTPGAGPERSALEATRDRLRSAVDRYRRDLPLVWTDEGLGGEAP